MTLKSVPYVITETLLFTKHNRNIQNCQNMPEMFGNHATPLRLESETTEDHIRQYYIFIVGV